MTESALPVPEALEEGAKDVALDPRQADLVTDNSPRMKTVLATVFIERSQALYLHTGNPIHAWRVSRLPLVGAT